METTLRVLVALALTGLLIMLRLDAERFGAAEYDEPQAGVSGLSAWTRRLAWYVIGLALVVAIIAIHPAPATDLFLDVGDRAGGVFLGIILGLGGVALAVGVAWFHYRRLRLPDVSMYPGALANEIITAFIDEATFRGAVLGFLLLAGLDANLAILGQAFAYTLATRLGAPGRDRYLFLVSLIVGILAGWATVLTQGIGAAFLGHAITRVAIFLTTGHAGQPALPGREVEDVAKRRSAPDGWSPVDEPG
ncbi:MAG TPA: CPBP family glutamic-type intramembrane protease [Candidatus Limnocylindrales bacterium]|nr:CPBP family glutamic-type intramembrane protease [Candidatus Limnocylindrales bacterium]